MLKIKRAHSKTKFYHPNYGLGGDDKMWDIDLSIFIRKN